MDHVHSTPARVVERLRMWNWRVIFHRGVQLEEGWLACLVSVSVVIGGDIVIRNVNRCSDQQNRRNDRESEKE